jgi:hypothetical protein
MFMWRDRESGCAQGSRFYRDLEVSEDYEEYFQQIGFAFVPCWHLDERLGGYDGVCGQ